MKILQVDNERKYISGKLKSFCKKQGITIKYAALYIYEENKLVKWGWKTIVIMKDSILINSNLLNGF